MIHQHRSHYPLQVLCRALRVSRRGYYAWLKRRPSTRSKANEILLSEIRDVHHKSRGIYGSPRVHAALKHQGIRCSRKRVARLMRKNRLFGKSKKRFRVRTTDSHHDFRIAPNLLEQNFEVKNPNEVWVSDISYIPTQEGFLYLATVMDLCTRRIIGWSMGDSLKTGLALSALEMAIQTRPPPSGLIHHSDRGVQYASDTYRQKLQDFGVRASMSRKGNCYDNAPMESFFHSLKVENVHEKKYQTKREAKADLFDYIEVFYNRQRLHSSIGYLSPVAFEEKILKKVA